VFHARAAAAGNERSPTHAPRRTVRRHQQPTTPWFDNEYAAAKRRARTFERRYRRTRIAADRFVWIAKE